MYLVLDGAKSRYVDDEVDALDCAASDGAEVQGPDGVVLYRRVSGAWVRVDAVRVPPARDSRPISEW